MLSKLKELLPALFTEELWLVDTTKVINQLLKRRVIGVIIDVYDKCSVIYRDLGVDYTVPLDNLHETKEAALAHMKELQEQAYRKAAR